MRNRQESYGQEEISDFDWSTFEEVCQNQCTKAEISAVMGMSIEDIDLYLRENHEITFDQAHKSLALCGKANLRRYQMNLAKYNASMAMFLGKIYLNQTEGPESNSQVLGVLDRIRGINVSAGRSQLIG